MSAESKVTPPAERDMRIVFRYGVKRSPVGRAVSPEEAKLNNLALAERIENLRAKLVEGK